jgi:NADPH-dependent 2,4-dienoyl-CoA reductase/sulfur reductase-like enzyme
MATIDPDMGARVAEGLRSMGVELRLGSSVTGFEQGADGWVRAVGTDTAEVPADLVVMGLGVRPNVKVAADAGIRIGPSGGIATDARMQTSAPEVWAAGDCVESLHRVSQRPVSIALGTHASKQGRVVGLNVSGTPARFPGVIGTAVTKVGDIEIGRTGLNEREAAAAGFVTVTATIEGSSRAHYYPDGAPLTVKIVAEHGSGRLLGVQIVGGPESAKRIDAMAVAVWNEMRVDDVAQLDLGYAPPFSPVWDSTLIAARRAGDRLR